MAVIINKIIFYLKIQLKAFLEIESPSRMASLGMQFKTLSKQSFKNKLKYFNLWY